ncbi:MAG: hypothetical protein N3A60_12085, partial [Thermanaerothrix sp.]|nr:hypothetical protein [Thermanaerothrix sp.]
MKRREEMTPELVETCLQALEQGQTIETILSQYPEAAADLAPLLQAAQHSRAAASTLRVPLAARARSRARFLDRAKHLRTTVVSP